jgi:hypothetical protein
VSTVCIDRPADDVQGVAAPWASDDDGGKPNPSLGENGREWLPLRPTAPITKADVRRAREIRLAMIANGYSPLSVSSPPNPYVPAHVAGKKPSVEYVDGKPKSWAEGHSFARLMKVSPMSTNTGLLLGGEQHLVAIDIDPAKIAASDERKEFAGNVLRLLLGGELGPVFTRAPARSRFPGSVLLLLRADTEIRKLRIEGQCGAVELLSQGQQVVVDGLHPSSTVDNAVRWTWRDGRAPWTLAIGDLPVIPSGEIERLLEAISAAGVLGPPIAASDRNVVPGRDSSPIATRRGRAYPAAVRLRQLLNEHEGRVLPAIRQLVEKVGAAGTGRHDTVVAICGRLVARGWDAARAVDFLVPLLNQHFLEGDWTEEVERAFKHAEKRHADNLCKCGSTKWPRR